MSEYILGEDTTLQIGVECSLSYRDGVTVTRYATRLERGDLELCITEASAAFLDLVNRVSLPERDDAADEHPWMSFKLSLMHMHDVTLVTRNYEVSGAELIYSTDSETPGEKLGEVVNQVLPIFVGDLHGLGITLQEVA